MPVEFECLIEPADKILGHIASTGSDLLLQKAVDILHFIRKIDNAEVRSHGFIGFVGSELLSIAEVLVADECEFELDIRIVFAELLDEFR